MISKYKYIIIIGLGIALLACVFFIGRCSREPEIKIIEKVIVKFDTATKYIVKQSEPIVITKYVPKLEYRTDTIIQTYPFEATVDTIIRTDTIQAKYQYPENIFDMIIRQEPDSILIQTITIEKEMLKERAWWEAPAYVMSGSLLGLILGLIVR